MGLLYPMFMLVVFLGFNATASWLASERTPLPVQSMAMTQAQNMVTYRNAITNYVIANTGYTGSIPITALVAYLPPGMQTSALPTVGNNVTWAAGGGRQVVVYGLGLAQGTIADMQASSGGDASIGTQTTNGWVSNVYPNNILSVSAPQLAAGNVMSVFNVQ